MLTNRFSLPDSIFRAIKNDPYDAGDSDVTCTQLISPVQLATLYKRHKDEIEEDISERIWSLLGQSIHTILERSADENTEVEVRYFRDILGWKVSGAIDLIEDNVIKDIKVTSTWTIIYKSRFKEWEQQSNINNFLRAKKWGSADGLQNICILRDWVKSKSGTGNYPLVQIQTVDLKLWDLKDTEKFVTDRVKLFQEAQKCSDEELAIKFPCSIEDRWLNERNGTFTRCEQYCAVGKAGFCLQFKKKRGEKQ